MKREVLRLEQVFVPPWLSGLSMDIYEGELDALIAIDYLGMDYMLDLIQRNLPVHYGRVFYGGIRVNDQEMTACRPNKIAVLKKKSSLIDTLTVAENLFVIRSGYRKSVINYRMLCQQTKSILGPLGLAVEPGALVNSLTPCEKLILELAKAWVSGVRLVVLREISNFVTTDELMRIISTVRLLSGRKMGFLYICNHHQEVFRFCDRCFLMGQGRIIKCLEKEQMTDTIIQHYCDVFENWAHNKERRKLYENSTADSKEGFFCNVEGLSFSMKKGESVILLDSDSRIINYLFDLLQSGKKFPLSMIRIDGKLWNTGSPSCALIPLRPVSAMLFPQLSVLDNLCFMLDHKVSGFWFSSKKKDAIAQDLYPVFGDVIYARSLYGLDEKLLYDIVYQRILLQHPSFICAMQPLASADQLMRLHLLSYFDRFRQKGITVCILGFSLSDSLEVADRLLVIKDRKIDREYQRSDFLSYPGIAGSRPE